MIIKGRSRCYFAAYNSFATFGPAAWPCSPSRELERERVFQIM
jgi:hypothetical protein